MQEGSTGRKVTIRKESYNAVLSLLLTCQDLLQRHPSSLCPCGIKAVWAELCACGCNGGLVGSTVNEWDRRTQSLTQGSGCSPESGRPERVFLCGGNLCYSFEVGCHAQLITGLTGKSQTLLKEAAC